MIDIIIPTWINSPERFAYFVVTAEHLKHYLRYGDHEPVLKWYAATEKIDDRFDAPFTEFCKKHEIEIAHKEGNPSLSGMMNYCNKIGDNDFIFLCQDDWLLMRNINFKKYVDFLRKNHDCYIVRLNYHTSFSGHLMATKVNGIYHLNPSLKGYYYADNPHIKKRSYHEATGCFPDSIIDGKDQGRCENAMNRRAKEISNTHKICAVDYQYFRHIGFSTTLKDKTFDR